MTAVWTNATAVPNLSGEALLLEQSNDKTFYVLLDGQVVVQVYNLLAHLRQADYKSCGMMSNTHPPFDDETWQQLPGFFDNLPQAVQLHLWGIEGASDGERETAVLCRTLANHFDKINYKQFSRRKNYNFWPVLGVMGDDDGKPVDYGVRIIGWPKGYQLTSLITAIQVVAFQAQTLEPLTRIQLQKLPADVTIEVLSAADNESGALVAKIAFGLAVANEKVKSYLIMADEFPEALVRHSAYSLPHTVVNGRVHIEGVIDESTMMKQIAQAVKKINDL